MAVSPHSESNLVTPDQVLSQWHRWKEYHPNAHLQWPPLTLPDMTGAAFLLCPEGVLRTRVAAWPPQSLEYLQKAKNNHSGSKPDVIVFGLLVF